MNMMASLAQSMPEGRVFALDSQTLIGIGIQLLNAIILAVGLGRILYKPVKEFMQNRTEKIQNKIDDSDTTMAKANELIAEYDAKISDIQKERIEILEETRLKADDESKRIIDEAHKEANAIKQRSLESVSKEKNRLKEETRDYIIDLTSLMAKKYVSQNIDNETQDKVFEETLAQLEDSQWPN